MGQTIFQWRFSKMSEINWDEVFVAPKTKRKARKKVRVTGTEEQEKIWEKMQWCVENQEHMMIEAGAGTGKTFTVIEGAKRLGPNVGAMRFIAFGVKIAKELQRKAPRWCDVGTAHSFGYKILRRHIYDMSGGATKVELDMGKTKYFLQYMMDSKTWGRDWWRRGEKGFIARLVGYFKNMFLIVPKKVNSGFRGRIDFLIEHFGMELPDGVELGFVLEATLESLKFAIENLEMVDFDDQLWLPLMLDLDIPKVDVLFVDECQDLNAPQKALLSRTGATVFAVGDPNQAIYGFRGAGTNSMDEFAQDLGGVLRLPLSQCWRCGRDHVRIAQAVVPQLQPNPQNIKGEVKVYDQPTLPLELVKPGHMVIARKNASLVSEVFRCWASGIKAFIYGRDISGKIIGLVWDIVAMTEREERTKYRNDEVISDLLIDSLLRYEGIKVADMEMNDASKSQIDTFEDLCQCANLILNQCPTLNDVTALLAKLFSEGKADAIGFSTGHQSKGLEAEHVWIINGEDMPLPFVEKDWEVAQELNLLYVAVTRVKKCLNFVGIVPEPIRDVVYQILEENNQGPTRG
jgi:DNA helicase-2/ATP-dependent DNA helicase PcrA